MSKPSSLFAVCLAGMTASGCHSDPNKPLGPADSYILFAPVAGEANGTLPVVRRLNIRDEAVQPLPSLLESSFPFEMVRTAYLAKQFVREASVDGQPFTAAARRNAAEPTCLVLGLERSPYGRGLALPKTFGGVEQRPDLPWIGLPAQPAHDKALVQTVAGRLATFVAHFVGTGGALSDGAAPPTVLVEGYRIAMEVIAREWRVVGSGPGGVVQVEEGSTAQREIFANVRENRYVLHPDGATLRDGRDLLADPGVAATVIYRMAQSRALAGRAAPEGFYAPFASRFPPGISPAAVLGTFRNFQAKFLGTWATAVLRGHPPQDLVDLIELYGAGFPAERAEVVRIFVVTTFGATVKPGGVSTKPQDSTRALAELTAMTSEIVAAKRTLREAMTGPADARVGGGQPSSHGQ